MVVGRRYPSSEIREDHPCVNMNGSSAILGRYDRLYIYIHIYIHYIYTQLYIVIGR